MQVVQLTNPEALDNEEVNALFERAFEKNRIAEWNDGAREEVKAGVRAGVWAAFVGVEQGKFLAMALLGVPQSTMFPIPIVYQYASFGSADLRKALARTIVDFLVNKGYTKFHGVNATGVADAAYQRWVSEQFTAQKLGSVLEFTVK